MNQYKDSVIPNYPHQNMVAFPHSTFHTLKVLIILKHSTQHK